MKHPFPHPEFGTGGPGVPGSPGGFFGRGRGGRGGPRTGGPGRPAADVPDASDAVGWFIGRLPDGWFVGTPRIVIDREEITVVGKLPPLEETPVDPAATAAAEAGRIARFREETRERRIEIARQAEHRYQRHVTWGAVLGTTEQIFTQVSVPVMTRLLQPERQVLDTLIDAGVARSRSEALAWSVRLVGEHAESWLSELRQAMEQVNKVRSQGPTFGASDTSAG